MQYPIAQLPYGYCTGTYTEVKVLLLWSNSNVTLEYQRLWFNRVAM